MPASSHILDRIAMSFDDDRAVADTGLLLTGTLMGRLGLESTIDEMVGGATGPEASWPRWLPGVTASMTWHGAAARRDDLADPGA